MTDEEEFAARSQLKWTREGDACGAVGRAGFLPNWVSTPLRITIFFVLCCYGWLLFRAHSFDQTKAFSLLLLGFGGGVAPVISKPTNPALLGIVVLFMLQLLRLPVGEPRMFQALAPSAAGLAIRKHFSSY